MKTNTNREKNDEMAAIGIGAMIVFIALILVAAVAAAVIIQTAEKLQQNAQATGEDTADSMSGKISINQAYTGQTVTNYELYARLSPGSDPTNANQIRFQLFCTASATVVDGTLAATNVLDMGTRAAAGVTTLQPSTGYVLVIPAGACAAPANGEDIPLYLHVDNGGTTYELLQVPAGGNTAGTPVI